jgi:N-acetyl-beta-hexosaminidase
MGVEPLLSKSIAAATSEQGTAHALGALSQLLVCGGQKEALVRSGVSITDGPACPYRVVLLGTSHNLLPIAAIKEAIKVMSWNRLGA